MRDWKEVKLFSHISLGNFVVSIPGGKPIILCSTPNYEQNSLNSGTNDLLAFGANTTTTTTDDDDDFSGVGQLLYGRTGHMYFDAG